MGPEKKTEWRIYGKRADFNGLSARFSISPVLARIMVNRGVAPEAFGSFLNGTLSELPDAERMKGIGAAADLLLEKQKEGRRIRVIGDYDIDGICATAILLKGLRAIGAEADYDIPDRMKDGYGLNIRLVEDAHRDGVDTLLTCDNGIAAIAEIAEAKKLGMTVIVTDHHEVGHDDKGDAALPPADVVVDPKQPGCEYPFRSVCGAVVAWKLVDVLFRKRKIAREKWLSLLPFAAIATVGDVMPLTEENRIIVREGLRAMKECRNMGLRKLMEYCSLNPSKLTAFSIGFVIGPCLNAGGRLESAKIGLELLMEENEDAAAEAAQRLTVLNEERKAMTNRGAEEAALQAAEYGGPVLVVYLPDCHESVAGIVAGRVRERFYRPSIILTDAMEEGLVKGSGRSIEGYHMFRELEGVKDLLIRFGGHPMAAGMTLKKSDIAEFRERLNRNASLTEQELTERTWIDTVLPFGYLSEAFVEELKILEPFGQGNERPVFAQKDVRILSLRVMGRNRNVVRMTLRGADGTRIEGILYGDGDAFLKEKDRKDLFSILYYPEINDYMGYHSLQVKIIAYRWQEP